MTEPSVRTCPDCRAPLDLVDHEGVSLDRCPAGHGTWLDRGELRQVVVSEAVPRPPAEAAVELQAATIDAGHAILAEAGRPSRACPVCATGMRLTEYAGSGIPIDECVDHGVWLDDGELERIEAYAEGVRRLARPGIADVATSVRGIDIPSELVASIRRAVPPPTH
jgi:Zn-finger nucleic acid-binding protein